VGDGAVVGVAVGGAAVAVGAVVGVEEAVVWLPPHAAKSTPATIVSDKAIQRNLKRMGNCDKYLLIV
jgi:hypothetical protein